MAHGDTVIHGDGVELLGNAPRRRYFTSYQLAQVLQVHMARDELGERVHHRDDRFFKVAVGHAGGPPQGPGTRHVASGGGCLGSVLGHAGFSRLGPAVYQLSVSSRGA